MNEIIRKLMKDAIVINPKNKWQKEEGIWFADGLLARQMVQKYPNHHYKKQAKLWNDLKEIPKYQTAIPIFPSHPAEDSYSRKILIGEVRELRADEKEKGIFGKHIIFEDKAEPELIKRLEKNEPIKESIGFYNSYGKAGILDAIKYDASQDNILLAHLGFLYKDEVPRCETCQTPFVKDSFITDECPDCHDHKEKIEICPKKLNNNYKKIIKKIAGGKDK